jgi:dsRNA-specific ribonuclease
MLLTLWNDNGLQSADVERLVRQYIAELNEDIQKLQSIQDQLKQLAACCHGDHLSDCRVIDDFDVKRHPLTGQRVPVRTVWT